MFRGVSEGPFSVGGVKLCDAGDSLGYSECLEGIDPAMQAYSYVTIGFNVLQYMLYVGSGKHDIE